jgi:hypothetical protein
MKNFPKTIYAVLAAGLSGSVLFTQEAQATQVYGEIFFRGSVRLNSPSFLNATQVVEWSDVSVSSPFGRPGAILGDFSGIPVGTPMAMAAPFTFKPSTAIPGFWSVGGFTFDLPHPQGGRNEYYLGLGGMGIVRGNGFEPTSMYMDIYVTNRGDNADMFYPFRGYAETVGGGFPVVPDGDATVALLGLGLGVIEFLRRKLRSPP